MKELNVLQVEEIEGRWYPLRSVMEDKLRKDTSTEVILKAIEFNPLIPEGTFTLENLR